MSNSNSKRIDVRHLFLRELTYVSQGDISVTHIVPSESRYCDQRFNFRLICDPSTFHSYDWVDGEVMQHVVFMCACVCFQVLA